MSNQFIVYLRRHSGTIDERTRTVTSNPETALSKYAEFLNDSTLDGSRQSVIFRLNTVELAYHRFDKPPESNDYFQDHLQKLRADLGPYLSADPHRNTHRRGKSPFQVLLNLEEQQDLEAAMDNTKTATKSDFLKHAIRTFK